MGGKSGRDLLPAAERFFSAGGRREEVRREAQGRILGAGDLRANKYGIIRYIDIHDIADRPKNKILFAELRKVIRLESELETVASKRKAKSGAKKARK